MTAFNLNRFFSSLENETPMEITLPEYRIDGERVSTWDLQLVAENRALFLSKENPGISLEVEATAANETQVVRFRFLLKGEGVMTKESEGDALRYLSVAVPADSVFHETVLANYDHLFNQFRPSTRQFPPEERFNGQRFAGPLIAMETNNGALLLAVEHGGDHPNPFLTFEISGHELALKALKGNYLNNQPAQHTSPWFIASAARTVAALKANFRKFLLRNHGPSESRQPYIFYNTWNHQERVKYLKGQPYLSEMNLQRMLDEIDVAHAMGIEVFVIDTGWYAKTGDWLVDLTRFPDGLKSVREKLETYGMRMGLWFNPIVAAKTSTAYLEHPEWVMEKDGKLNDWGRIWETEESLGMCLVSGWADYFTSILIRLYRELGVSYFKWDAVGLWGCDSDKHDHGGPEHSSQERAENYAFESGRRLTAIAETISRECPGAIVDFDVTEGGRYFGLGFLAGGKFFLVNNGPYYSNFDIPSSFERKPDTINVFFHPGPARPRVCRGGYRFDDWIPATLYLTHYLPDGDSQSLVNSFASLVLGGNGIWGSLPELTSEERAYWHGELARYKQVREAVNRANPIVVGEPGLSPEIHEKLDPETGEGIVVFFNVRPGTFTHVTQPLERAPSRIEGAKSSEILSNGRVIIAVELGKESAAVITFHS